MTNWKDNISFVLVETIESGNIGASARALKNLGFKNLDLVRPQKYPSKESGWFAHGAEDVLSCASVYEDLESCLRDRSVIVGTTRRTGRQRGLAHPVRLAAEKIRSLAGRNRVAILFGREDRGLTNKESAECSFMLNIPANPGNPSFNIAQAVLIVAYELSFAAYNKDVPLPIISNEELSALFERIREVMKLAGYEPKGIRDSEESIMRDLRKILGRTCLSYREARMVHGIISQIEAGLLRRFQK